MAPPSCPSACPTQARYHRSHRGRGDFACWCRPADQFGDKRLLHIINCRPFGVKGPELLDPAAARGDDRGGRDEERVAGCSRGGGMRRTRRALRSLEKKERDRKARIKRRPLVVSGKVEEEGIEVIGHTGI